MRILYFTQYFVPEAGATQARAHDMARAMVGAGHEVVLICEVPNHPAGRIWPAYRGSLYKREPLVQAAPISGPNPPGVRLTSVTSWPLLLR